jgi:Family of unknown function (DUF5681)
VSDTSERSRSPRTGRFQKGHSGNPNGRPRKQRVLPEAPRSAFEIVLEKRVTVTRAGIDQELSVEEALQLRTYQDALAGNRAARREVLKMSAIAFSRFAIRGLRTPRAIPSLTREISTRPKKRRRCHVSSRHRRPRQKPRGVSRGRHTPRALGSASRASSAARRQSTHHGRCQRYPTLHARP